METMIAFNRLNATYAADGITSSIVKIQDLGDPIPQEISPGNFTTLFGSFICPLGSESSYCNYSALAPNAFFTFSLYEFLRSDEVVRPSTLMMDILRNLFATVIFIYNPVYLKTAMTGAILNSIILDLPSENYFNGSVAHEINYASPKRWTIIVYLAVGGFLLVLASSTWFIVVVDNNGEFNLRGRKLRASSKPLRGPTT